MSGSAMNPTGDELGGGVRAGAMVAAGSGCAVHRGLAGGGQRRGQREEPAPTAGSGAAESASRPPRGF